MLDLPMTDKPARRLAYPSEAYNWSAIIRETTGRSALNSHANLFGRLASPVIWLDGSTGE
jgi:hypothetical protein